MSTLVFASIIVFLGIFLISVGFHIEIQKDKFNISNIILILVGIIAIMYLPVLDIITPLKKVKVDEKSIDIKSIDTYDINDDQQYKITTEDGVVYNTGLTPLGMELWNEDNSFASVEESKDNDFHLYSVMYQEQRNIGSLVLVDNEFTDIVLEVPHEYYILHTNK